MNDIPTIMYYIFGMISGGVLLAFYLLVKDWLEERKAERAWLEAQDRKPKPHSLLNIDDHISINGAIYKITKVEPFSGGPGPLMWETKEEQ